jgi:hypothetical protein
MPREPNPLPGVCGNCWGRFTHYCGDDPSADNFNKWLARQLHHTAKRLRTYGVTGRCEAVSGFIYGNRGLQCGSPAVTTRDGRRVCHSHGRVALAVEYVDESNEDVYDTFRHLIATLAKEDARFFECVQEAVADVLREEQQLSTKVSA